MRANREGTGGNFVGLGSILYLIKVCVAQAHAGVKNHRMHKVWVDLCIPLQVDVTSKNKSHKKKFFKKSHKNIDANAEQFRSKVYLGL